MSTTLVNVAGRDGGGKPITLRADQNADNSLALHTAIEIGGVEISGGNQLPVADATADAALGAPADTPYAGSGTSSIVAALKGLYALLAGTLTATITGALPAGTNAIGTVGVTALPALAAGTNAIGAVSAAPFALTNSASGVVTTAAEEIVPFSASRKWLAIYNRTTGIEIHDIGSANVLVGSGIPIAPGGGFLFNGAGAAGPIYGITSVTNSPFSYVEG